MSAPITDLARSAMSWRISSRLPLLDPADTVGARAEGTSPPDGPCGRRARAAFCSTPCPTCSPPTVQYDAPPGTALPAERPVGERRHEGHRSEQGRLHRADAAQRVVVDRDPPETAVASEHPGLRPDVLGGEQAPHGSEQRVAVEQLDVPRQLLDPVDVAAPLDLHRDPPAG